MIAYHKPYLSKIYFTNEKVNFHGAGSNLHQSNFLYIG